jgi:hypothetical protein
MAQGQNDWPVPLDTKNFYVADLEAHHRRAGSEAKQEDRSALQ